MHNEIFYKYYDDIFKQKDYAHETDVVFQLAKEAGVDPVENILEIGCGTGNHTLKLAEKNIPLTAIDCDLEMVGIAQNKIIDQGIDHVEVKHLRVEELWTQPFDLALALFNVVTYIDGEISLSAFFKEVRRCLKEGGVFIFDCWNGVAVANDLPASKTTELDIDAKRLVCELTSDNFVEEKRTTLNYHIKTLNAHDQLLEEGQHQFDQHWWTPAQIRNLLDQAGFKVFKFCAPFAPDQEASDETWKVMFVCQAC